MSSTSYDQLWRTSWGDLQRFGPVHRHASEDLLRTVTSLNDVRTVLDVGCGSGDNLGLLATSGRYELTGVDGSTEALAIARQRVGSGKSGGSAANNENGTAHGFTSCAAAIAFGRT